MNKKIIYAVPVLSLILLFAITIFINRNQVYPTSYEEKELNTFFEFKEIHSSKDILFIQNKIITEIKHEFVSSKQLSTDRTLKLKKGFCYDRSLVLQKYFLMKGFKVRPVYLFWNGNKTAFFDFLKSNVKSHNVFELFFKGKWYIIRTNKKMTKLESLRDYLISGKTVPTHSRYIRYLNNRNGDFLYPSYLPDIYFF